jgi:hypothetical protein
MFVTQLALRRRRGLLQVIAGGTLLALLIPAWLLVRGVDGAALIMVMAGSVMTISGITVAGRGALQVGRATQHLHAVAELRRLPTARARLLGP